VPIS